MGKKYRKYKNFLEKFLDSNKGRRFFTVAYSVGAAIVIAGALFKLRHLPHGDMMLTIGMVTEIIVFLLSAFERPPKEYKWEEVYPMLADNDNFIPKSEREKASIQSSGPAIQSTATPSAKGVHINNTDNRSGSVVSGSENIGDINKSYGTSSTGGGSGIPLSGNITIVSGGSNNTGSASSGLASDNSNTTNASANYTSQMSDSMDKFAKTTDSLAQVSDSLLSSFKTIIENSASIGNNTQGYISQMETLNKNIAGLNTIYEIQLKGVSSQINTIEHINAGLDRMKKLYDGSLVDSSIFQNETEKMAKQLAELNRVYARMLQAMTTNMNMGGGFNPNMGNSSNNQNPQD